MKLKLLSMLAGASLITSAACADTVAYTFLDQDGVFFDVRGSTINSSTTFAPTGCYMQSACSQVSFIPTAAFDEIKLSNGDLFQFAATAFTTPGFYNSLTGPANKSAQFSTQILRSVSAAPEPATWALMMMSAGIAGYALRRSQKERLFARTVRYV